MTATSKRNPGYVVLVDEEGNAVDVSGTPGPGSITSEMFAEDAKAPLAGVADSANTVANGAVTTGKLADDAITLDKLARAVVDLINEHVKKSGDTLTGNLKLQQGVSFGQQVGGSPHDLSKHVDLWGGVWGINVTSGNMNFNTSDSPANSKYVFYHGTTLIAEMQETITDPKCLTTKEYVDGLAASKLASIEPIADPSAATTEDVATLLNSILAALQG